MDHIILAENRVGMVSNLRCFKTATLVDTYIDDDRVRFHFAHRFFGYDTRAAAVRRAHGAYGYITGRDGFLQHNRLHYRGKYPGANVILQSAQFINRWVEHLNL